MASNLHQVKKAVHCTVYSVQGEIMLNTMTRESKYRKNCESCPTQVTWKVKFKCQFCLSHLSPLSKNLIHFKITKKYNLSQQQHPVQS